jgi:hypothetical protein
MATKNFGDLLKEARTAEGGAYSADNPVQVGTYTATIAHFSVRPTKKGDKQTLSLKCVVDSGPSLKDVGWWSISLDTTNTVNMQIFMRLLRVVGVTDEQVSQFNTDDHAALLTSVGTTAKGKRCEIKVQESRSEARPGPEVRFLNQLPGNAAPSRLGDKVEESAAPQVGVSPAAAATAGMVKRPSL